MPPGRSTYLDFHVELDGFDPDIWRRIHVPGDATFWTLHVAIQDAMGWQDSHLHSFEVIDPESGGELLFGLPDASQPFMPGWEHQLVEFLGETRSVIMYEYDFGDCWRHRVTYRGTGIREKGGRYPRCVDGQRRCPPEDVGGVPGFQRFLEAMADPRHEEHQSMLEWYGGPFDLEDFSPRDVKFQNAKKRLDDVLEYFE